MEQDPGPMAESRWPKAAGRKPLVVGLVGGIGSGKSEVTRLLAGEAGVRVISGDALAHEALRRPEIRDEIVRRWGTQVLDEDGTINRKWLGGIVFAEPSELKALEALVHPWIKRRIREELEAARREPSTPLAVL